MICEICGYENDDVSRRCDSCHALLKPQQCEICGKVTFEISNGVCNKCLEKYATVDNAISYGIDNKECVEINGFFAMMFSPGEIERLLRKALVEKQYVKEDARTYCLGEYSEGYAEYESAKWFIDWAKKEGEIK